jgi:hypothetical protein
MPKALTKIGFEMEMNAKLNQLIDWAIEHSPKDTHHLSYSDFAEVRDQFNKVACGLTPLKNEPEPEEGGAQYINVTPAPWP